MYCLLYYIEKQTYYFSGMHYLLDDDIGESLNLRAEYSLLAVEHSPLLL